MVTLTARAGALLSSFQNAQADSSLPRLTTTAGTFTINSSSPATDDEVVHHAGIPVLLVAKDAAAALGGQILTLRDLRNAPVLVILPSPMSRTGRRRTLRVGGRARPAPAIMRSRGSLSFAGPREQARRLATDVDSNGVTDPERAYCDACQLARPGAGSVQDGRYALCNACAVEYVSASARGHAVTTGQFVRDKVFGETIAYLLRNIGAEGVSTDAGTIRSRAQSARRQRDRRVNIEANPAAAARRAVIRLPRNRNG
jgi:hypothetical protein